MKYTIIVALVAATSAQFAVAGSHRRSLGDDRQSYGDDQRQLSQSPQSAPWQQQQNGNGDFGAREFNRRGSINTFNDYRDPQGKQDWEIDPMDVDGDLQRTRDQPGLQQEDFYKDQDVPSNKLQRNEAFLPNRQPDYEDTLGRPSMFGLGSGQKSYDSYDSQSLGGFDTDDEEDDPSDFAANAPIQGRVAKLGDNLKRKWQGMFKGKQQPKPRPELRRATRMSEEAQRIDDVEHFIVSQERNKKGQSKFGALKSKNFGGQARPQGEPELSSESLDLRFDSGDEYGSVIGADLTFAQDDEQKPPSFNRYA
ncbi:hypothetical protein MIR68_003834 [Amoeboaphelidium protococcarum]|nr:hypothetical protein MIR68_003834 [Amoeboaphelidium protococcarum]